MLRGLGFGVVVVVVALSGQALANRAASGRARPSLAQKPAGSPLKSPKHLQAVQRRTRTLSSWVIDGEPGRGKEKGESFFHAAFAELIPIQGVSHKMLADASYGDGPNGSHADDHPARFRVSGVTDGIWRGHLIGTTSVHDLVPSSDEPTDAEWKQMAKETKARIASDYIQISYDHGPETPAKVLVSGVKARAATAIPIEVPLNPNGLTRVIYERTNAQGRVVGGVVGYGPGRIIELEVAK